MTDFLTPGQVAERSGFSLDTLRYYERVGLLGPVDRGPGGRRRYADESLEWLRVLRCLRDTGMPIAQMRRYAELARAGESTLRQRLHLLAEHDARVEEHIADLRAQQDHIRRKIDWYRGQLESK